MATVTEAWIRIEGWLHQHTPRSGARLAGPATSDLIMATEVQTGVAFPAELVESLLRHDGLIEQANLFPEAKPLAVKEISEQYEIRMDIAPDVDGFTVHAPSAEPWWHELWLPFGDAGYGLQVIDMRPGPRCGRLGMAATSNPADFSDGWPSLSAYLTAIADALEQGGTVGKWHPYVVEDETLWWDLAGRTEVNGEPLRPAPSTGS
ncbi:cell wall assembly regulator SMI1 [Actinoplanes lutulentus]|uniref:SMI1/KNR4 family protein n=1 Tax=Actinoplanes lutulentus TaxID=1287878 RepID=UPI000DBAB72A|nr:SMI1/KNR4 family protein [Actinoplanes lutulentus]MBB2948570.1 cell wall assembly regulator SMI1 [Actinoplanes lutulentus]